MAVNSQGKVIRVKNLAMDCSKCIKDKDKLWWFNSDTNSLWDNALYCKECYGTIFKKLPEEVKKTFAGYKERKVK